MRSLFAAGSLVLLVAMALGCQPASLTSAPTAGAQSPAASLGALPAVDPDSGLPFVALADLPPEAAATLALIDAGGPFPYTQDGAVFQNREGILPARAAGWYHEYTVVTPGSPDRGARRIVTGTEGELYWTDDHYDSFHRIVR